jgi:hypothetical protein
MSLLIRRATDWTELHATRTKSEASQVSGWELVIHSPALDPTVIALIFQAKYETVTVRKRRPPERLNIVTSDVSRELKNKRS